MLNSCHIKETARRRRANHGQDDRKRAGLVEICIGEFGAEARPSALGGSRIIHEPTVATLTSMPT
jgi:hypothetical protein